MRGLQWTDERVDRLRALWRQGLSASQVAAALGGVTRNAVIGKLWRLGLMGLRPPPPPRPRRPKAQRPGKPPRRAKPLHRPRAAQRSAPDLPGLVGRLEDLRPGNCRWPLGDPRTADFAFCGRRAEGPYCPAHHAVAHRPALPTAVDEAA